MISLPLPSGIKTTDHLIQSNGAEIRIREYAPESIGNIYPAVVYFHGGGWVIGSIETHEIIQWDLQQKNLKQKFSRWIIA